MVEGLDSSAGTKEVSCRASPVSKSEHIYIFARNSKFVVSCAFLRLDCVESYNSSIFNLLLIKYTFDLLLTWCHFGIGSLSLCGIQSDQYSH